MICLNFLVGMNDLRQWQSQHEYPIMVGNNDTTTSGNLQKHSITGSSAIKKPLDITISKPLKRVKRAVSKTMHGSFHNTATQFVMFCFSRLEIHLTMFYMT